MTFYFKILRQIKKVIYFEVYDYKTNCQSFVFHFLIHLKSQFSYLGLPIPEALTRYKIKSQVQKVQSRLIKYVYTTYLK